MANSTVVIRRAEPEDAARLAPLFDTYRRYYGQSGDIEGAEAYLQERLAQGESVVYYVPDNDGTPLGFTQLYPAFSSLGMRREWILNDLFVVPEARRRGFATALLNSARDFAAETGAQGMMLETHPDNEAARGLYERHGWQLNETYCHYYLTL